MSNIEMCVKYEFRKGKKTWPLNVSPHSCMLPPALFFHLSSFCVSIIILLERIWSDDGGRRGALWWY